MAQNDCIRAWFNRHVPKTRWPALLKIRSLCSGVASGKGGDLKRFLHEAKIPKDKWQALLASGSLSSAVAKGKGGDLMRFLESAQIPKTKRASLLGSNSLFSACSALWRTAKAVT
jgi:hypothetical protein